jgi:hypothetical protein
MNEIPPPKAGPRLREAQDELKTDTPTGEHRIVVGYVKNAIKWRPLIVTVCTLLLGGTGAVGVRGKLASDDATDLAAAARQKLDDHLAHETEHHQLVMKRLDDLGDDAEKEKERAAKRDLRTKRLEVLIELELDQHRVPESKRPKRDEEE